VLSLIPIVVAATVSHAPAAGQQEIRAAEDYLAHVVRYHTGSHAPSAKEIARWSASDLRRALRGLPHVLDSVVATVKVGKSALVGSAMTMHADIARSSGAGEVIGLHLSIGIRLADLLPEEGTAAFRAQWHLLAGTLMLSLTRPSDASRQFEAAYELQPRDPDILLAVGSLLEFEASLERGERERQNRLKKAVDHYQSALSASSDLYEARLRLARAQHLLGEVTDAAATIGALDERAASRYLRYATLLIRGSINESQGRMAQAVADYREAYAICGVCQSASVALSHALLRSGDRDAARAIVRQLLSDDTSRLRGDPWWGYQQAQWHASDRMLERLRRVVPQ